MNYFATNYGIQLIRSTLFLCPSQWTSKSIQQSVDRNPGENARGESQRLTQDLSETLWAYKTSKMSSTGVGPFSMTYGQDAILPMEVVVPSIRVSKKNGLTPQEYGEAMMIELESTYDRK